MAYLVLVRHGMSEDNAKGVWSGWRNPHLTEKGIEEARKAGEFLKDIHFDQAFTSDLTRAQQTLDEIKKVLGIETIPIIQTPALKEKNYGDFGGKNKWEIKKEVGDEEFMKIRRSWDYIIPGGESLEQVYKRVVPYYQEKILPLLKENKNILISLHGNSMRAFVKYLDNVSDNDIPNVEIATGEIYVYQIDENGKVIQKEIRGKKENTA